MCLIKTIADNIMSDVYAQLSHFDLTDNDEHKLLSLIIGQLTDAANENRPNEYEMVPGQFM